MRKARRASESSTLLGLNRSLTYPDLSNEGNNKLSSFLEEIQVPAISSCFHLPVFERVAQRARDHGGVERVAEQLIGLRDSADEAQRSRVGDVETGLVCRLSRVGNGNVQDDFLELAQFQDGNAILA